MAPKKTKDHRLMKSNDHCIIETSKKFHHRVSIPRKDLFSTKPSNVRSKVSTKFRNESSFDYNEHLHQTGITNQISKRNLSCL